MVDARFPRQWKVANMGRLDGKVAAVTGGASGIGEATVRRFLAESASVAFCDRDGERGQRVAAELEAAGAKIAFTHADVGTEAACLAFVNAASVRSIVAGGGNLQYDTTKAAVAGLTRALAADHSPDGIRVNAVGPGPIFTPFHQRRIAAAGETVEQYNAKAAQGTMLKRPGRAEEVAAAILFLASDDASYVTGALLFVDGGMTAL